MTELVLYDAARKALAELSHVDEVKEIRDKAEALATYARLAKEPRSFDEAYKKLFGDCPWGQRVSAQQWLGTLLRGLRGDGDNANG